MKYTVSVSDLTADQAVAVVKELESMAEFIERPALAGKPVQYDDNYTPPVVQPATAPVAPVPQTSPDVDSAGMTWDERIHASTKATNKDGTWKQRRGVQPIVLEQVTAELKAKIAPVQHAGTFVPAAPPMPQVPASPLMAAPQAPAPAAPAAITRDFQGLMQQVTKLFANKSITPDYPNTIVARVNSGFQSTIATISDVANDPRMVEYAWQCLEVDGKAA